MTATTVGRGVRCWRLLVLVAVVAPPPSLPAASDLAPVVTITAYRSADAWVGVRSGLGFITESSGFVLTAYDNLIDPATGQLLDDIRVTMSGSDAPRAVFPATIIGVEPTIKLGILKVDAERSWLAIRFAPAHGLASGLALRAVAIDNDGNLAIVAGRVVAMNTAECYQESLTSTMVRAEIEIPARGAGAPVFDADGFLVAIFTGYRPPGVEDHAENAREMHLLPAVLAYNVYESIKTKRSLRSPWTGFAVRALDDDTRARLAVRQRFRSGIAIDFVWSGSPAEKLGIQPGDVLTQFGHYPITSVADFQKWLYLYGVGHAVKLVFLRDGSVLEVDYLIEARPSWAKPR